jgi:hypothetical protein
MLDRVSPRTPYWQAAHATTTLQIASTRSEPGVRLSAYGFGEPVTGG